MNAVSEDAPIPIDARAARLDLLRRAAALGFALAAIAAFASTILPDPDTSDHGALHILAAVLAATSVLLALGRWMPPAVIIVVGVTFATLITCVVIAVARPMGVVPVYLVYSALTAAYFCTRREAMVQLGVIYVALAVALTQAEPGQRTLAYFIMVSILTVVALVVAHVTERQAGLQRELHAVASTDALTGLLSRRAFGAAFGRELQRSRRAGLPLSLVLFDLDHFKLVNDRYGHAVGDQALVRFAGILTDERRPGDLAARMGGEEFLVALFDCDEAGARTWAQRIVDRLAAETADGPVRLTTSAGVAEARREQTTLDEILPGADRALYAAKAAGRHRVTAFSDPGVGPLAPA